MEYKLPLTLENILTGLLSDRDIAGWKILAEKQLTLIIRFSEQPHHIDHAEAHVGTTDCPTYHSSVTYRRKPPTSILRDRARWSRWNKAGDTNVGYNSGDDLSYSTPKSYLSTNACGDSGLGNGIPVDCFDTLIASPTKERTGPSIGNVDVNCRSNKGTDCMVLPEENLEHATEIIPLKSVVDSEMQCSRYDIVTNKIAHAETQTNRAHKHKFTQALTYKTGDSSTQAVIKCSTSVSTDTIEYVDKDCGRTMQTGSNQTELFQDAQCQISAEMACKSTTCLHIPTSSIALQTTCVMAEKSTMTENVMSNVQSDSHQQIAQKPTGFRGGPPNRRKPYYGWGYHTSKHFNNHPT